MQRIVRHVQHYTMQLHVAGGAKNAHQAPPKQLRPMPNTPSRV